MAILSDSARKRLESNPNVSKVTTNNVTYTAAFKIKAVKQFLDGESYESIFSKAGVDLTQFESNYARKSVDRWHRIFKESGEEGLKIERRGSGAKGRPKGKKFKSLEAEVAYLRAENDFLKKLNALEAAYLKKKNSR